MIMPVYFQGRLGDEPSLIAAITILANDDPYGMFTISEMVRTAAVPEASSSGQCHYH